jgi:hypothetical protein
MSVRRNWLHEQVSGRHKATHVILSSFHKNGRGWKGFLMERGCWMDLCGFEGCDGEARLGAHVFRSASNERRASWYVIPACSKCNNLNNNNGVVTVNRGHHARIKTGVSLNEDTKVVDGRMFRTSEALVGYPDPGDFLRLWDSVDNKLRKKMLKRLKWFRCLAKTDNKVQWRLEKIYEALNCTGDEADGDRDSSEEED